MYSLGIHEAMENCQRIYVYRGLGSNKDVYFIVESEALAVIGISGMCPQSTWQTFSQYLRNMLSIFMMLYFTHFKIGKKFRCSAPNTIFTQFLKLGSWGRCIFTIFWRKIANGICSYLESNPESLRRIPVCSSLFQPVLHGYFIWWGKQRRWWRRIFQ